MRKFCFAYPQTKAKRGREMKQIQAPHLIPYDKLARYVFLAGSIEMGNAEKWQDKIIKELRDSIWTILNPRRDDWDSSWVQSIENKLFNEQVIWELDALEAADIIVLWFDPNTKSPISLLELGLFAGSEKMLVYCPEGFWRKGNVDIVCERNGIPHYETEKDFIEFLKEFVEMKI